MALAKSNFSRNSRRAEAGFSIVEVMVATGLLASALVALAQLFAIATTTNAAARSSTLTMMLAEQKIEQLRALQYTFDRAGLPVQDTLTDLSVDPPAAAGGKGLSPHTENTLQASTDGYVDYLDPWGRTLGGGTVIPDGTAVIRRWSVEPLPTKPRRQRFRRSTMVVGSPVKWGSSSVSNCSEVGSTSGE